MRDRCASRSCSLRKNRWRPCGRNARGRSASFGWRRLPLAPAVAYGLHLLRPVVQSVRGVGELTTFPVLGSVSVAFPSRQRFMFRRRLWRFSAATLCLVVALAIALGLNWSGIRLTLGALNTLVNT